VLDETVGLTTGEMNDMSATNCGTDVIGDADRSMWSWCAKEIAVWLGRGVDYDHALEKFNEFNETRRQTHLFRISAGQVSIAPKPSVLPDFGMARAKYYQDFIQSVVSTLCPELDTTIAIDSGDGGFGPHAEPQEVTDEVPVFVFQKQQNAHGLLLPDIDFLREGFPEEPRFEKDLVTYDEKSCSAIFVGATTGGRTITRQVIADLANNIVTDRTQPRLRAAFYFKDNPDVQFLLPVLHQYDSMETADLLRSMGFGSNVWVPWKAQFAHRFIISIDGNGATCSRVARALKSNSVLLKYTSKSELYYFSALAPWTHYIPVESDEDVSEVLRIEQKCPGFFRHIAKQSQEFADRYLTRPQAMKYMAWLLRLYASSFRASSATPWTLGKAVADPRLDAANSIRVLAHIAFRGDVWFARGAQIGEPDKQLDIQGFKRCSAMDRSRTGAMGGNSAAHEARVYLSTGCVFGFPGSHAAHTCVHIPGASWTAPKYLTWRMAKSARPRRGRHLWGFRSTGRCGLHPAPRLEFQMIEGVMKLQIETLAKGIEL
jgi:hypothetical protein